MGSTIVAHEGELPQVQDLPLDSSAGTIGIDVSHYQGDISWGAVAGAGVRFVYMKATEGSGFVDPAFSANYTGSTGAGMVRGAYSFALPDRASGAAEASYFLAHGGGWSADGRTLPPVLDIEYNPYNAQAVCYGLNQQQMTGWVQDFANTVHNQIGRWPVIYTTTNWWTMCTGNTSALSRCPLWIARYNTAVGQLPAGWADYTLWQHSDGAPNLPGDQDYFNGSVNDLAGFATGSESDSLLGLP
ncbi:MAG TPA: GH25 family lysozyme [Pseudonocardiaceae bacterium]|nr:GH25 family lysozyme [Pseudonocardiaceae bacterium]